MPKAKKTPAGNPKRRVKASPPSYPRNSTKGVITRKTAALPPAGGVPPGGLPAAGERVRY